MTKDKVIKTILKAIIEKIKPDEILVRESLKKVSDFLAEINNKIKSKNIFAKAVLGGSFAKGTWVKGDYDVDIFVKFNLKYHNQDLSKFLEDVFKNIVHERVHGSRDYFLVKKDGIDYEIIPVLDIKRKEDAENVTDFSPWHVDWVNKKGKKLKDDIILLKKFLKASKIYGAENYIKGFSGHVVDILSIYYNGFINLLKEVKNWKSKKVIDKYNVYKGKLLLTMNKSKTSGPLILVDPVMSERNASAAVDEESFHKFIKLAKDFLSNPKKEFFEELKTDFKLLEKKGYLLKVYVRSLEGKEDIVGTKVLKVYEFLKQELEEFGILVSGWDWDKKENAILWFVVKKEKINPKLEIEGPPSDIKDHVRAFKAKHKNIFEKKGRVYAIEERKNIRVEAVIKDILNKNYVKDKVKKIWI